jgi:oligopeptide/dipeptide ABC transporter ATP-binding protein
MTPVLAVRDLVTQFHLRAGVVRAVDGVSFEVGRGETVGIVGESGSGKSVTALSVLRLIAPPGRIVAGEVVFDGRDVLALSEAELRRVRGRGIAMIFQNPRSCLNPVMTVGQQVAAVARLHRQDTRAGATARALEMLRAVQIPDAGRVFGAYPHQLSGGMCQRVMIAMAMVCEPALVIADEPTTGLDVTVQRQILALMHALWERTRISRLLISHDMGVVATTCDRVVVMYAGKVVEAGPVRELFKAPLHPYTRRLVGSTPRLDDARRPSAIAGDLPDPVRPPDGCRFHPRCVEAVERCRHEAPRLESAGAGRVVACHLAARAASTGPAGTTPSLPTPERV